MSLKNFTDYKLSQDAYLSFDASSLKDLIIKNLNTNEVFTDQNFEGSNFSAFIDVVAYMYHVLLFYLNTTSNETTFTTATLYESMNKLVSNIGYKPQGDQTSLLTFELSANPNLTIGQYTLPRYSYVNIDSISYYTLEDTSFQKTVNGYEGVSINNNILYQGSLKEAVFTATGEEYETLIIVDRALENRVTLASTAANTTEPFISDNSFSIYVQDNATLEWSQWVETSSLFLTESNSNSYEKRLNESGNYEFKFGNNNNGKKLNENDRVIIFYLVSDNNKGIANSGSINGKPINLYNSSNFNSIKPYIYTSEYHLTTSQDLTYLTISNQYTSTPIKKAETVDEIRANAPKAFASQNRLVTAIDYEAFINKNFNNIVKDVKILSNEEYTSQYLRYFYTIGLERPNDNGRVLLNQVNFSASTNFNNVYVFMAPREQTIINEQIPNYLNTAQKQLIVNACYNKKDITHNVVPSDPIFKAFSFGVGDINSNTVNSIVTNSTLLVNVDKTSSISDGAIRSKIEEVFINYFSNIQIGDVVDTASITNDILGLDGVTSIYTVNGTSIVPNINFIIWNPDYSQEDKQITSQNYHLRNFEYAYFYQISNITTKIVVQRI